MMSSLLASILTFLAKLHLARFKPRIVGITGNAGKTSTRDAVAAVLASRYRVRSPAANMNTELGMPATIIGDFSTQYIRDGGTPLFWLRVLAQGVVGWLGSSGRYPEVLVLEYGADKPGDIHRLVSRFPAEIGVVTQVGEVPVHVEFFASAKHLAEEKMQLIKHLSAEGHAVLNYDDLTVLEMKSHTAARVHTFGLGEGADVQVRELHITNQGVQFDITTDAATMPVVIRGTVGRGIATAAAAAVAVGQVYGIGLADAVQALTHLQPPAGRMRILPGIKGSRIVDDTYNSSPAAVHLALDTIKHLEGRKIVVLGDMLELGQHTVQAHRSVGDMAGDIAAELVCVGERARFIADSAANSLSQEHIHWFADSIAAGAKVQELVRSGDVLLVKGSQGMRMERIVREVMAEPNRAGELLVRQSARWLAK